MPDDSSPHNDLEDREIAYGENFISLVENANEGIVVVLSNGILSYANEYAVRMFGYVKTEVIGRNIVQFIAGYEFERIRSILTARLRGESAPDRYSTVLVSKDRAEVRVEFSVSKTTWGEEPASLVVIRKTEHAISS